MFKKLSRKELILYSVAILIAIGGIVFMILGLVADNAEVGNDLDLMQRNMVIPLRFVGLIIFGVALIYFLIVTLVFAKQVDRVSERETRRKQRLEAMLSDSNKETILVKDGKVINEVKKEETDEDIELKSIDNNKDKFDGNL